MGMIKVERKMQTGECVEQTSPWLLASVSIHVLYTMEQMLDGLWGPVVLTTLGAVIANL